MASNDPFPFLLLWVLPIFYFAANVLILAVCIFGALHPSLRREFIWLALASASRCVSSILAIVPNFLQHQSADWISSTNIRFLLQVGNVVSSLGTLFYVVGFMLLAVRSRTLPAPPR